MPPGEAQAGSRQHGLNILVSAIEHVALQGTMSEGSLVQEQSQNPAIISRLGANTQNKNSQATSGTSKASRWRHEEVTALFIFIYGPENDYMYERWLKNRERVYQKFLDANPKVAARFSVSGVASKITASYDIYTYIRAYDEFTGGGGDADLQALEADSNAWHKKRITLAK
ncbi:hypothetical protein C8R42DRAFT_727762 [Lentinula raphanica]|nr:hypothetical protein C8R42DRAFT_727762 [Lentinula raphanica]